MLSKKHKQLFDIVESIIKDYDPSFYKNHIKRPIKSPKVYFDWKHTILSKAIPLIVREKPLHDFPRGDEAIVYSYVIGIYLTRRLIYNLWPTYYVTNNLLQSLINSKGEISVSDINQSLETATFMIPANTLCDIKGKSVIAITVCLARGRDENNYPYTTLNRLSEIHYFRDDPDRLLIKIQKDDFTTEVTSRSANTINSKSIIDTTQNYTELDNEKTYKYQEEIVNLTFNLFWVLGQRPDLISTDNVVGNGFVPVNPKEKGRTKAKSLYRAPRWLGKNYQIQTEKQSRPTPNREGVSPCTHIRRGHFRRQKCGKGFSEEKIIWIEPMFVNLEKPD